MRINFFNGLALAASGTVLLVMLSAVWLLPALLSLLGDRAVTPVSRFVSHALSDGRYGRALRSARSCVGRRRLRCSSACPPGASKALGVARGVVLLVAGIGPWFYKITRDSRHEQRATTPRVAAGRTTRACSRSVRSSRPCSRSGSCCCSPSRRSRCASASPTTRARRRGQHLAASPTTSPPRASAPAPTARSSSRSQLPEERRRRGPRRDRRRAARRPRASRRPSRTPRCCRCSAASAAGPDRHGDPGAARRPGRRTSRPTSCSTGCASETLPAGHGADTGARPTSAAPPPSSADFSTVMRDAMPLFLSVVVGLGLPHAARAVPLGRSSR